METNRAVNMFLYSRSAKGLSPATMRWYRGILAAFEKMFPVLPQSPEPIEQFLAMCKAGDERRHGYYRTLRCFYRFLNRRLKVENPMEYIDPPRRNHKQPRWLMPEDLNSLIFYRHPAKIKTALLFLIDTGARLGEVSNLQIEDLEQTPWGFMATINGKTGMRYVPINYETYHALMVNLPLGYTKYRLGRKIAQAFKEAGIKGSAITLRHTFATLWEGDELALQRIMGHAHLSTTRLYRHLRMKALSTQHHQFSPLNMLLSASKSML